MAQAELSIVLFDVSRAATIICMVLKTAFIFLVFCHTVRELTCFVCLSSLPVS